MKQKIVLLFYFQLMFRYLAVNQIIFHIKFNIKVYLQKVHDNASTSQIEVYKSYMYVISTTQCLCTFICTEYNY